MSTQVQLRRGNPSQNAAFTGSEGEVTYDISTSRLFTHDGVTPGGHALALKSEIPTQNAVSIPIGGILPWDKSATGTPALPSNFVECNGQLISDSDSPFNGQHVRNLNSGGMFLRGGATSGTSGGSSSHTHGYATTSDVEDGDTDIPVGTGDTVTVASAAHLHPVSGTTDAGSSLPPHMEMVWIIRIK